jgi:hypothetical protein
MCPDDPSVAIFRQIYPDTISSSIYWDFQNFLKNSQVEHAASIQTSDVAHEMSLDTLQVSDDHTL